jgi:protein involved in polysaccharide export with SLBB domain
MRSVKTRPLLTVLLWAALTAALSAGCNSTPRHNRRVYDRYAELVAERNRKPEPKPEPPPAPQTEPVPVPAPEPAPPVVPAPVPDAPPPAAPEPAVVDPAAPASPDGVYLLKVGDVVQIFLRGIPAAEAIENIIDEHGKVSLPFINEIQAAGQSASELARSIRQTYLDQGIYRNISVNVAVPTRYYFIQGEIRAPGRYQIMSATRVSQAIAGGGGYTEFASGQVLIRRGGKVFKTIRNARRLERSPQDDIQLEPDDIIEVKRSLW